jgi:hypothetical protein
MHHWAVDKSRESEWCTTEASQQFVKFGPFPKWSPPGECYKTVPYYCLKVGRLCRVTTRDVFVVFYSLLPLQPHTLSLAIDSPYLLDTFILRRVQRNSAHPPAMAPTTSLCELCPKAATNTCIACGNSRYCSKKCQKRGHKQHKLLCSTFDTFNDTSRPSELHRRAIYFPVDEAQPRFIWLPFTRKYEADYEEMYDRPVRGNLLGPNSFMQLIPIRHNATLKRDLDDTISLMIRETGSVDGSAMNRASTVY